MIALTGGLAEDAGPVITVTRKKKWGAIPLPNANVSAADFSTVEIKLQDFLSAAKPAENITIFPNDVITVPRAELIYVIGAVRKPGAFPLKQRGSVSILQALSMAEGLGADPAPGDSKILRAQPGTEERKEIPVDVKKVMAGKGTDVDLQANDVLFVPTSTSKQAAKRVLETITRVPIWGF
jgi:polysaccharide export outer membrane protein